MRIVFDAEGSLRRLTEALTQLLVDPEVRGIMLLLGAASPISPAELRSLLSQCSVPVFGGLFPEVISGTSRSRQGSLLVGFTVAPVLRRVDGLDAPDGRFDEATEGLPLLQPVTPYTLFVLADGFASGIGRLLESLFINYGLEINYLGGGAGDLERSGRPCVLTQNGLEAGCAVLAALPFPSGVGVRHGWQPLAGPLRVTEASGNTILSLDGQPAFEVYRQLLQETGVSVSSEDFFAVAQAFPFGINRLGGEMIIRDPLALNEQGGIRCAGPVTAGAYLYLMRGEPAALLAAAAEAREVGEQALSPATPYAGTLVFDCISRALFLQDHFAQELAAVAQGQSPLFGALTIGEIANSGRSYLEFFNKTTVVARLGETAHEKTSDS